MPVPAVSSEADRLSAALRALAPQRVNPAPVIRTARPFYGASLRGMEVLARAWHRGHPEASAREVLHLADALWAQGIREEMVLAAMLVGRRPAAREAFGLRRFDRWGALLDNWETTDNLGSRVLGPWAAADPEGRLGALEVLACRRNPWLRRLALVGCVSLGRRPDAATWWPRVSEIILTLAADREAAIPKAISWVLRAHSGRCPEEVAAFLEARRAALPAIAVREARNKLATGYKAGRPPRSGRSHPGSENS
jgi:3-methyladenine DNA glycosylase AlkD